MIKLNAILFTILFSLLSFSASAETVNLNKANADALQYYLKGIGDIRAKNIIKYRQANKKFKSVDEIQEVNGIGEIIFKNIKSKLSLTKGVTVAPEKLKSKTKKVTKKKTKAKKVTKKKTKNTTNQS